MATFCFSFRLNRALIFKNNLTYIQRNIGSFRNTQNVRTNLNKYFWIIGGGVAAVTCAGLIKMRTNTVEALTLRNKMREEVMIKLTARERRFIKFASVDFDEQLYMTPQDFLDSVVEQEPRPRLKRKTLSTQDVAKIKDETPPMKKGSVKMFRNLRDKGIISYTEYLFLLSVLTKPRSGFRIAFNMFDTDGNQRVDKNEFLVIQKILGGSFRDHVLDEETRKVMERIFSGAWKEKRGKTEEPIKDVAGDSNETNIGDSNEKTASEYIDDEEGLQRRHNVDTTIQLHFFGKKGTQVLQYEGFYTFMDNLQTEVLEIEFQEFAKGNRVITEVDFAKILLRYTYLDTEEYDVFLERLLERVKDERGITFDEFRDFCRFLNNLEDFIIAMRMYTLADRSISKDEFSRAVKICTGFELSRHVIDTVFAIFDEDGDGLLSYKEFIAIMKDRLHRGFKVSGRILEYNEELNEYNEPDYPLFAMWRHRVCRHLDYFIDSDALF